MTYKELLVSLLTSDSVLGPIIGTRVYDTYMPELTPDQIFPCLTYKVISRQHVKSLQGNSGTYYPRIEITVWSLRSADVSAIADRLYVMEGPQTLSAPGGKPVLRWLWVEDEADDATATNQQDESAVRSAAVDVVLWYDG